MGCYLARRTFVLAAFWVMATAVPASADTADITYEFTYSAASGPIQSFNFSFDTHGFITSANESPAFGPFTIGDGINSWAITQDVTSFSLPTTGDFCFATAGTILNSGGGGCTASYNPPDGFFEVTFINGLPSTTGTFTSNFGGSFYTPAGVSEALNVGTGDLTLTVSEVPEPSSIVLLATLLVASFVSGRRSIAWVRQLASCASCWFH
jgi:hypothetical protein